MCMGTYVLVVCVSGSVGVWLGVMGMVCASMYCVHVCVYRMHFNFRGGSISWISNICRFSVFKFVAAGHSGV